MPAPGWGLSARACDSCHLLPPGLFIFRFTSGCSGRDPALVTFSNQIHTAVGLETASKPVCPVKRFSRRLRAVPLLSCSASPPMCPLSGVKYCAWAEILPHMWICCRGWVSERPKPWSHMGSASRGELVDRSWQHRCGSRGLLPGWGALSRTMDSFVRGKKRKKRQFLEYINLLFSALSCCQH